MNSEKKFKFKNDSHYVGKREGKDITYHWFNWTVYLDESQEVLDEVDYVEYRLHPTFPNPIHEIDDKSTKFALSASGWGEFKIFITVYLKDGTVTHTSHELKLEA